MVITNLENEELISLVQNSTTSTELEKELAKRLAAFQDDSNFLKRFEELEEDISYKQRVFIVCASSIFLKEPLPDDYYFMPSHLILDYIKNNVYGDYKNFSPDFIWKQLTELSKNFTKDYT
jgi:hypothetical protein